MNTLPQAPPTRMVGYVRVSPHPDSKENPSESPENQERIILKVVENLGARYLKTYCDRDKSAYKLAFARRPAARELLLDAQRGDVIVVASLDRIERGGSRRVFNVLDTFKRLGLGLHAVREFGERRVPNETAFDELLLSAMAFGARWEAEQAKERALEMHRVLRHRGMRQSLHPSVGYRFEIVPHPEQPGKTITLVVPDLVDASICVEIWRRYKSGWSFPTIATHLNLYDKKGAGGIAWVTIRTYRRLRKGEWKKVKYGKIYCRMRTAYRAVEKALQEGRDNFCGVPLDTELQNIVPPMMPDGYKTPDWLRIDRETCWQYIHRKERA